MTSGVQQLVDAMLDRARTEHPQVEWSIAVPDEQILLLPRDAEKLWRTHDGRLGYYRSHVYRDCEVIDAPLGELIYLAPLLHHDQRTPADDAPTYIGHLPTGQITTAPA